MDLLDEIISLYVYVCTEYENGLWEYCQRFSNYSNLSFMDEEVITIYMYGILQGLTTKKQIYKHAKNYWNTLFPQLPSYVAFVQRINKLGDLCIGMIDNIRSNLPVELFSENNYRLIDSMPIILAAYKLK